MASKTGRIRKPVEAKKPAAKKISPAQRKAARELAEVGQQFDVTTKQMVNGQPQTVTRRVPATTDAQAIQAAKMADPGSTLSKQVTATKIPTSASNMPVPAGALAPSGAAAPATALPGQPARESVGYPYGMMLPLGFRKLMDQMNVSGVSLNERYGHLYVTVGTFEAMQLLKERLRSSRLDAAKIILGGIEPR